jgi:pimeloyl-ACP methyl ester carboxylesterase
VDRRGVPNEAIIRALEAEDPSTLSEEPAAAAFRVLADALGSDRQAILAQARAIYRGGVKLDRICAPTLLLAGAQDPLALRPEVLTRAIPDAELRMLAGNHVEALGDPRFARSIVDFLA